jgi:2-methylaconitate cis-trans-isomerase PrpF
MFPTGRPIDFLDFSNGKIAATLINAGNPTVFVRADDLGLKGTERQDDVNGDVSLLARLEAIRAQGAVAMGLARTAEEASRTVLHTPKLAFVAPPRAYIAPGGKEVREADVDLVARIVSMGKLHHAMTGTGAVAIAVAAAIPGTLVRQNLRPGTSGGTIRFGHASGTLTVGAEARKEGADWVVTKAVMSRSARRLMEGWIRVPSPR